MRKILCIVDPWDEPLPNDVRNHPNLPMMQKGFCTFIHSQIPNLFSFFNKIVVIDSGITTNPLFDSLPKGTNTYLDVKGMHPNIKNDAVFFCGFNLYRCIDAKIDILINKCGYDKNRIGILYNLSFSHPDCTRYTLKGELTSSTIQHYHWDYNSRLIPIQEFLVCK
jgi:hypothetical protein